MDGRFDGVCGRADTDSDPDSTLHPNRFPDLDAHRHSATSDVNPASTFIACTFDRYFTAHANCVAESDDCPNPADARTNPCHIGTHRRTRITGRIASIYLGPSAERAENSIHPG